MQIAESELRTTLETLLDAVVVLAAVRDPEGVIVDFRCTYANPAAVALEGATDGTLLDRRLLDLDVATASDGTLARWIRVVETGEAVAFESARPGSSSKTYDVRAAKLGDGLVVSYIDVTARKDAERLLAAQSLVLERIAGGATLASDLELIESTVEEALPDIRCRVLLVGEGGGLLVRGVDASADADGPAQSPRRPISDGTVLAAAAAHRGEVVVDGPHWAVPVIGSENQEVLGAIELSSTGSRSPTSQAKRVAQIAAHLVGLAVERARAQNSLSFLALHDPLTGLPNRTLFLDRLNQLLAQSRRTQRTVAVLFLDIDNFKVTNDTLGHEVGDGLLIEIGRRLQRLVRAGDTVARFGGDEFAFCCHDVASEFDASALAERVIARLSEVVTVEGNEVASTFSMGIAVGTDKDLDSEELLRRADVAMYRAKERGRSRFEIFNEDLQAKVVERHETEQALRAAVKAGEFSVLYQPLIWLGSGALMGVEALVRWNRPGRGRLLPQEFIAVAEQSEIIVEIGDFVLTQACHDAAEWLRTGVDVPSVSVNVSVRQLMKPSFTQTVTRALDDTGLAPERLCLEITETLMIDEADTLAQKLSELRAIGVRVPRWTTSARVRVLGRSSGASTGHREG